MSSCAGGRLVTPVAQVLNGAADLIERDGWAQGPGSTMPGGPHCIDAAINAAGGHLGHNDEPGRTKAEVVAALRAAAERAS